MNTAKTIRFNTGREYQPEGQLISAVVVAEKVTHVEHFGDIERILVLMVDHSRGLDYLYELETDDFTQPGIMSIYDERNSDVSLDRLESFWDVSTEHGSEIWKLKKELQRKTERVRREREASKEAPEVKTGDEITFNTGACYGEKGQVDSEGRSLEGQLIDAVVVDTREQELLILMVDRSRGVRYLFEISPEDFNEKGIMRNDVYGSDHNGVSRERLREYWKLDTSNQAYWEKENAFNWHHSNTFGRV